MSLAPKNSLLSFGYDIAGSMSGGFNRTAITVKNKRKCVLRTSESIWHYQKPTETRRVLPISVLREIETVFRENYMQDVTEAPLSDTLAPDEATLHYSFDFGEERFYYSSVYDYPEKIKMALAKIRSIVTEL